MAFENFPYTDIHELNLDWLLAVIKQMQEKIEELEERIEALEGV